MRSPFNESSEEELWEMLSDSEEDLGLVSNEPSSLPVSPRSTLTTNETTGDISREGDSQILSIADSNNSSSCTMVSNDLPEEKQVESGSAAPAGELTHVYDASTEGEAFIHVIEDDQNPDGSPESTPPSSDSRSETKPPVLLTLSRGLRRASRRFDAALQDMDQKVQQMTKRNLRAIKKSTRSLGNNIRRESKRVGEQVQGTRVQTERAAKATAIKLQEATRSAGEQAARLNEKYHITDAVVATATVAGAALLTNGNVKAVAGALTLAAASLAAGEALKAPHERDSDLNEQLHME